MRPAEERRLNLEEQLRPWTFTEDPCRTYYHQGWPLTMNAHLQANAPQIRPEHSMIR